MKTYHVTPIPLRVTSPSLAQYLLEEILPRYQSLDAGHNQNHIYQVLRHAYQLADALGQPVNADMLTTAVIYHDLGVTGPTQASRQEHELRSRDLLLTDPRLDLLYQISASREKFIAYFRATYPDYLA